MHGPGAHDGAREVTGQRPDRDEVPLPALLRRVDRLQSLVPFALQNKVQKKKKRSMKTIYGKDAVEIFGSSPLPFFLNLDITNLFYLAQLQIISLDT